jgi:cell division protein FtsQ
MTRRGQAVLDAPEQRYVSEKKGPRRVTGGIKRDLQEDFSQDFKQNFGDQRFGDRSFGEQGFGDGPDGEDVDSGRRGGARRRSGVQKKAGFLGWLPQTVWGRVAAGMSALAVVGLGVGGVLAVKSALLHDERFVIPDSAAIKVEGNRHVTKAQLLSIFGEDVDRNILRVSLAERRAELERLPWVEHATVMRLLPDHLRISIVERTPVAFVRQGNRIGLVDKSGVLMDMAAGTGEHYSFPVVTGIVADEPLSVRAARMKMFERFTSELDAGGAGSDGKRISDGLSEVDLSSPEDVKALIPDDNGEVLVHFGDADFLERYNKFKAHLAEWKTQYPKLTSVDMRYERQAVLEMQPGAGVTPAVKDEAGKSDDAGKLAPAPVAHAPTHATVEAKAAPVAGSAAGAAKPAPIAGSTGVVKTGSTATGKTVGAGAAVAASPAKGSAQSSAPAAGSDGVTHHLMVAKDVPATKAQTKKPVAKKPVAKKPAAAKPTAAAQYHPSAVAQ